MRGEIHTSFDIDRLCGCDNHIFGMDFCSYKKKKMGEINVKNWDGVRPNYELVGMEDDGDKMVKPKIGVWQGLQWVVLGSF